MLDGFDRIKGTVIPLLAHSLRRTEQTRFNCKGRGRIPFVLYSGPSWHLLRLTFSATKNDPHGPEVSYTDYGVGSDTNFCRAGHLTCL